MPCGSLLTSGVVVVLLSCTGHLTCLPTHGSCSTHGSNTPISASNSLVKMNGLG